MSSEPPQKNEPQPEETTPKSAQQSISASNGSTIKDVSQTFIDRLQVDVHVEREKSDAEELEAYLDWAVRDFEHRMDNFLLAPRQPDEPYKSLAYFEVEDSSIFFGRQSATQELYDRVLDNRLMILYGRSGAGKSSLLNAGLSPLLLRDFRLPVYVPIHPHKEDLALEIKKVIFPSSQRPWPRLLRDFTLHDFLSHIMMKRSSRTRELVIILDQFEQFLISLPGKKILEPFIETLRDCLEDHLLSVRFVISLKYENLGDLDPFEEYIPGVLQNRYRLLPMSEEEVRKAITGPVERIHPEITFESTLLDQLILELGGKNVELTHLQIVCKQLYEALPQGQKIITTGLYDQLGGVENILATYLDKTLEPLTGNRHKVAWTILRELVSSEGTNRVLSMPDFKRAVEPDPGEIENILEYLVNNRLVRREQDLEQKKYELSHAYLAEKISLRIGKEELENKKAQDLLQRELANHRLFNSRIDPVQLNYLRAHIRFLTLDEAARKLLFDSSLGYGHEVEFWIDQMLDRHAAAKVAAAAALENHQIAEGLKAGLAEDLRADVLSILWDAYDGPDRLKRRQAAETLSILQAWLSRQERSRIQWSLHRIRLQEIVSRNTLPASVVAAVVAIPLAIWFTFFLEHPVPGKWVTIPGGSFVMGMDQNEAQYAYQACLAGVIDQTTCDRSTWDLLLSWSGRQKGAFLKQYSIMDNEVTFAQYQQCVDDGACDEPVDVPPDNRQTNLPATTLTWLQAETYCEWLGGRLPTEAEWEKAARGPKGNYYPWGTPAIWDETEANKANLEHTGEGSVAKVQKFAETDLSFYGVKNMAGNVREWTATEYSFEIGSKQVGQKFSDPVMTAEQARSLMQDPFKAVIVRGGTWETARSQGIASQRSVYSFQPGVYDLGFRCTCPAGAACKSPWTGWWIWLGLD